MKVVEIQKFGVDNLAVTDRPEPEAGADEVVLRMKTFSVNYRDLLVVNGVGRWKASLPRIPLSDGVGVVVATGKDVSRVRQGDRVAPIFYPKWIDGTAASEKMVSPLGGAISDGILAEYTVINENSLVHVPEHLSDEEAATLPCAAVTAWNAAMVCGPIRPGDSVVILGTGGVSIFALQFARSVGAQVIITSGSDHKLTRAKELGVMGTVNYETQPDWPRAVQELTGGVGANHIVDTVGDLGKAIACVRMGGVVAFVGILSGIRTEVDLIAFMGKSARIEAIDVGSREMFEAMNKAIEFHSMRPVVDRVFGFSELREALNYLREARHFGKVCLKV